MIPASDFLASIERNAMPLLAALAALMVIVAAIATLLANRLLVVPLLRIAGQLKHIEDFRLDRITRVASPLRELDKLSGILQQMSRGLASSRRREEIADQVHLRTERSSMVSGKRDNRRTSF